MAQITNKRLGELIQALFRILEKHPDGMKAQEALAALADAVTLTEYEAGSYESGRRFEKIVRFATVDTVRAGFPSRHKVHSSKHSAVYMVTKRRMVGSDGIKSPSAWNFF